MLTSLRTNILTAERLTNVDILLLVIKTYSSVDF